MKNMTAMKNMTDVPGNMTDEECDHGTDENERKVAFFVLLSNPLPSPTLNLLWNQKNIGMVYILIINNLTKLKHKYLHINIITKQ